MTLCDNRPRLHNPSTAQKRQNGTLTFLPATMAYLSTASSRRSDFLSMYPSPEKSLISPAIRVEKSAASNPSIWLTPLLPSRSAP